MTNLIKKPYQVMNGTKNQISKVAESAKELNTLVQALKVTKKLMDKEVPAEILNAIELIGQIQSLEKQLGDAKKALKESVDSIMERTNKEEIVSGQYVARRKEFPSDNFDTKLFKEEHKKMYENYLNTIIKTRFEVKDAKVSK